jgi:hypothetical protein
LHLFPSHDRCGGVTADYDQFNASHLPTLVGSDVNTELVNRYTKTETDATFAAIGGLATNLFLVANGTVGFEAVNFQQLALKADITAMDLKADKSNVLELDNNTSYIPTFDFNPATKKYVDDTVNRPLVVFTGTFLDQTGKTVTVTNGFVESVV